MDVEAAAPQEITGRSQCRRIAFTINNWSEVEYDWLTKEFPAKCKWIVVGKEVGENGTPHLQGAAVFRNPILFKTVKNWTAFRRAHIERMRGSPHDNLVYCSKEDKEPFTFGVMPEQGKRNDILGATEVLKKGGSLKDLADSHPEELVKFHRGFSTFKRLIDTPRSANDPPTVYWLYGETGSGKTRSAFESGTSLFGSSVWLSNGGLQWFDGYAGQHVAIFDDFRSKGVQFDWLLRLLDIYPLRVPVKGDFVEWKPQLIIITTPHGIRTTFEKRLEHKPEDIRQLERRVTASFGFPEEKEEFLELFKRGSDDLGESIDSVARSLLAISGSG